MLDLVIVAVAALAAAVVAVFLILMAVNIALVVKLRSVIPPSPAARPTAARHHPPGSSNARR
jgi:hypothetical protein